MKLTEINENRYLAEKIKQGRSAMTTLRQFIVTNFANIAIALSIIFLILELNQNRRMMARELVFMEAQAYQGRSELAFDLHSLTVENPDLDGQCCVHTGWW